VTLPFNQPPYQFSNSTLSILSELHSEVLLEPRPHVFLYRVHLLVRQGPDPHKFTEMCTRIAISAKLKMSTLNYNEAFEAL